MKQVLQPRVRKRIGIFPNAQQEGGLDPALRLHPDQETLTPAQEAEARRFAEAYIQTQLSTEPVDEQEAEAFLRQAYEVAGLAPPARIQWLDGPLQLVALVAPGSLGNQERVRGRRDKGWGSVEVWVKDYMRDRVGERVRGSVGRRVYANVEHRVDHCMDDSVAGSVGERVYDRILIRARVRMRDQQVQAGVGASVGAYFEANWLAFFRFFDVYLAPNDLHVLAHFNELVSGYWLGHEADAIVRRPRLLSRDSEGGLHSATGKCVEYHGGWGFYSWHGVCVPEKLIMAPEHLTREDFLNERDLEVRRVIQERMGSHFVSEVGGRVLDRGPRGTLYEVKLHGDLERVARYVQVQDASTGRQYFLRVPPTIQTAAEAVAWTFQVAPEDYRPAQET